MKILITGADGFIGKHLQTVLSGYDLITADLKSGTDLTDITFWDKLGSVDVIAHLGAIVGVENFNDKNAVSSYINNRRININVLKYAEKYHPYVLFASSSEIYGECNNSLESDNFEILNSPRGLYALDKIIMENDLNIFGIRHSSCRLFNIIGNGQDKDKGVVPKFIYEITHGIKSKISRDVRTFTSVIDCVNAFKVLIDNQTVGSFNISSDCTLSIEELYKKLCDKFNSQYNYDIIEKSDISYRKPNTDKLKSIYSIKYSIDDVIKNL